MIGDICWLLIESWATPGPGLITVCLIAQPTGHERVANTYRPPAISRLALVVLIRAEGSRPIKNANACFPDDIPEFDRLEVACIDTNVELAGKRLELSMAVAV